VYASGGISGPGCHPLTKEKEPSFFARAYIVVENWKSGRDWQYTKRLYRTMLNSIEIAGLVLTLRSDSRMVDDILRSLYL
jgi:hypothetical protein